jgi:tetratricopeptide (TPR) repeat protein
MLTLILGLAACQSAEERAEEQYQTALALAAEGDFDRAIVSLRNVFQLDGSHREARRMIAEIMLNERGNVPEAYGQYLRLVEQYPDDLDARIALAEIAFIAIEWEELERHGAEAEALAPEDPRVIPLTIVRGYRNAALAEDNSARREFAQRAAALLDSTPENQMLRSLLVDNLLRDGELRAALVEIDRLLEQAPDNLTYNQQRLNVLAELGDMDGIESHLRSMIALFPEDTTQKATLLRFYLARDALDDAEGFLRELVAASPDDPGPRVDLIRFLSEYRSTETAQAEITTALGTVSDPLPFLMIDAGLDFAAGQREAAVETLEAALAAHAGSTEASEARVILARMLLDMGNDVGARARVEEALAEDPTQPEALKMRALWLIQSDETDAAISALRSALESSPNDAQAMTLMADAYTRSGRPELAQDFLALAVDASGNAPAETIRYAQLLIGNESYLPAEDILIASLRLNSGHPDLLLNLGQLYLAMGDLTRAQHVADTLRRLDTPAARIAANGIEAERINRQSGPTEALAYLEQLAASTDADLGAQIALMRARIGTGDLAGALTLATEIVAANPESEDLRVMLATTQALNGNLDEAEAIYRDLLDSDPQRPQLWLALSRLQQREGNRDAARQAIDEGLDHMPTDPSLLWGRASFLEQDGDIDGAIAIYEQLYAENSDALVVANNLASLLSTYRNDEESLERAWVVARRFQNTSVPAVQDTYGWILHRRGDSAGALSYLEAAATGLPDDPLVNYHLGETYLALGRVQDALDRFQRAVTLAGPSDTRPQIEAARARIPVLLEMENTQTEPAD